MKKIRITLLAVTALLGLFATSSQAEPHRPYHFTTVRWVVATRNDLSVDDNYVTLIGHVSRRIGDEEYWFTDGTGSVRLDSENFDLPIGARIIVGGRIDQAYLGFGHIEVDVRHWHYAPMKKRPAPMNTVTRVTPPAPVTVPTRATTPAPMEAPATTTSTATGPSSLTPPSESAPATNATPSGK